MLLVLHMLHGCVLAGGDPPIPQFYSYLVYLLSLTHLCLCFLGLKNQTDVWFVFLPAAPVETRAAAILASAGLVIILGLLTLFLLGHLLIFHIYLSRHLILLCPVVQVTWAFPSFHMLEEATFRCPLLLDF